MNKSARIFLICLILELMFSCSVWADWTLYENSNVKDRLRSIKMRDTNNGWAVGDLLYKIIFPGQVHNLRGVVRCKDGVWENDITKANFQSPELAESLLSIDTYQNGAKGWIVGTNGTILQGENLDSDSAIWAEYANLPTNHTLWSVDAVNDNIAYAVGNYCTIVKWNGSSWSEVSFSISEEMKYESLLGVHMFDTSNGWAVGTKGLMLRWNGSSWSEISGPTDKDLWSVYMVDSNNGWAVGVDDTILRYNGGSWSKYTFASQSSYLFEVKMTQDGNDGWIVGGRCRNECPPGATPECTLLRWNGASWNKVSAPDSRAARGVDIVEDGGSTVVWVVGNDYRDGFNYYSLIMQGP